MDGYTQIKGFSKYFVNKKGQIWSSYRNRHLKPCASNWGYLRLFLKRDVDGKLKGQSVHRIVANTFLSNNENKKEVNHKNCNKKDNSVENLEWCTASENLYHSYKNDRRNAKGENNANAVLNVQKVKLFRLLYEQFKWSRARIAEVFNLNRITVGNAIYYKHWKNV